MRSDQPYHLHRGIYVQKFTLVLINLDEVEFLILVSLKSLLVLSDEPRIRSDTAQIKQ